MSQGSWGFGMGMSRTEKPVNGTVTPFYDIFCHFGTSDMIESLSQNDFLQGVWQNCARRNGRTADIFNRPHALSPVSDQDEVSGIISEMLLQRFDTRNLIHPKFSDFLIFKRSWNFDYNSIDCTNEYQTWKTIARMRKVHQNMITLGTLHDLYVEAKNRHQRILNRFHRMLP